MNAVRSAIVLSLNNIMAARREISKARTGKFPASKPKGWTRARFIKMRMVWIEQNVKTIRLLEKML